MTSIDLSRRHLLRVSGLVLLAGVASCTTTPQMSSTPSDGEDETAAALPLVNQLRGKNGLTPLRVDPAASYRRDLSGEAHGERRQDGASDGHDRQLSAHA